MPCSPKGAIGVPSGLSLLFGFIIVIMGLVIMTSSIPESKCGKNGSITINQSDKDGVDSALMFMTWPLLLGGIFAMVGGGLGMFGGFKNNKCGVCSAAVLFSLSAVFVVIGSLAAMTFAGIFSEICDDYKCGAENICANSGNAFSSHCNQPGVCCNQESCLLSQCKETNDWACDLMGKKAGGMIVGYLGAIFILIAAGCSCGGSCCCVNSFEGLGAPAPQGSAPAVVGQVVGQAA
jgi:hypothetical protein